MPRPPPPRPSHTLLKVHALLFVAALVVGLCLFLPKVRAQPTPSARASTLSATPVAALSSGMPPAAEAPGADAGADNETADAGTGADTKEGGSPALDYAVIQTDEDFDPSLTLEQRRAIGIGKVPIHREGHYRSPFAHPRFGGAATARVGLVLNQVREYNIQTGSFQADFFLSLTSDKPMPPLSVMFTDGHDVNETVLADTPTFKSYRYNGTFTSHVDLRSYPFDTQDLTIELEDARAGVDQIVFEPYPERTSLDEDFFISGWSIGSLGARTYRHLYPPRFDRDDLYVSRYKFVLTVGRFGTSAAFSVYVPAFIIVIISLIGMWVPAERLDVRSNAGAPMLAAAVLFHYSLMQALPSMGYLTRADKLMLGVYVSLLLNMLSTWSFLLVREEQVDKLFRIGRAWVPPLTAVIMMIASLA